MAMRILFLLLFSLVGLWADTVGKVGSVEGTAHLPRKFKKIPLTVGLEIQAKDNLYTKADGVVSIEMHDGSIIRLNPDSHFKVSRYLRDTSGKEVPRQMNLFEGTARFDFKKGVGHKEVYRIVTPTSVAGVRGTNFMCRVQSSGSSSVTVFRGRVAVYAFRGGLTKISRPVMLKRGQRSSVRKNVAAPTKAKQVSKKELAKLDEETGGDTSETNEAQDAPDGDAAESQDEGQSEEASSEEASEPDETEVETTAEVETETEVEVDTDVSVEVDQSVVVEQVVESTVGNVVETTVEQVVEDLTETVIEYALPPQLPEEFSSTPFVDPNSPPSSH